MKVKIMQHYRLDANCVLVTLKANYKLKKMFFSGSKLWLQVFTGRTASGRTGFFSDP